MEEYFNRNTKKSYWLKRIKILKGEEPSEYDEAVANSIALYMEKYKNTFNIVHSFINDLGLSVLLSKIECADPCFLEFDDVLIEKHFNTNYCESIDYSIFHYFSGEIRRNRFYETLLKGG